MHFHLPKPLHGWRELAGEVGIIVVGVLIALGAEQVVSSIEWNRKVAETRDAVGLEVADNLGKLHVRVALSHCIDQRLDALAVIIDRASKAKFLPALATPLAPGNRSWSTGVWSSALSSQTASHFSAEQLRGYSRVYQIIDRISELEPKDEAAWTTLFELAGPGRAFDAQDARMYRTAIGQAREINGLMAGFGVREQQAVDGYHVPYDTDVFAEKSAIPKDSQIYCGPPAGTPPSTYGAAPDTHFADYALQHPTK